MQHKEPMTNSNDRDAEAMLLRNPNYRAAKEWAGRHMSDEDLARYNTLVAEPATRSEGVDLLYARWVEARQTALTDAAATATEPSSPAARDPSLFYSADELVEAQQDPLYGDLTAKGRLYREEVAEKLRRSREAGTLDGHGRVQSFRQAESVSTLGDRDAGWHENHRRELEAQRVRDYAARLEREAAQAREEAEQVQQRAQWTRWN